MAKNHYAKGDVIDYTASSAAVSSGSPVLVGKVLGIALRDIAKDATGPLAVEEVFAVRKGGVTVTQGASLYWDTDGNPIGGTAGSGCLTTTASGNTYAGFAAVAAAESDATVKIKINA